MIALRACKQRSLVVERWNSHTFSGSPRWGRRYCISCSGAVSMQTEKSAVTGVNSRRLYACFLDDFTPFLCFVGLELGQFVGSGCDRFRSEEHTSELQSIM